MLDLLLLSTGPIFLLGSIALAVWTDWVEGREQAPRLLPAAPDDPPALRLVR